VAGQLPRFFASTRPAAGSGTSSGIRFGSSAKLESLEVRAGLLGRRLLLIPVEQVKEIVPEQKRIVLGGAPQHVAQD